MKRIYLATGKSPTDFRSRIRNLMLLDLRVRLGKIFLRVWPWLKRMLTLATTILHLGYILNRSAVHSPFLLLAGVRLEKLTQQDMDLFEKSVRFLST
ncbi:hypothetical protein COOONC_06569 [Cooperia oncophora]